MIDQFRGEHRFLSNFHEPAVVRFEGEEYPTVEHAYQAAKSTDPEVRRTIREAKGPGHAKRLGQALTPRPDWDTLKLDVMLDLIRQKFRGEPLRCMLLDTGEQPLIEGNRWGDTFWGVCKGKGSNHLGEILMRVREELRSESA